MHAFSELSFNGNSSMKAKIAKKIFFWLSKLSTLIWNPSLKTKTAKKILDNLNFNIEVQSHNTAD